MDEAFSEGKAADATFKTYFLIVRWSAMKRDIFYYSQMCLYPHLPYQESVQYR